jgi:crotonobetainyl-CoA:carnitine CoA-transferase CaiB-like acyl-CoA transferase
MPTETPLPTQALAPYRVLDLTGGNGWLCGRMLADLGAEVIKVELPGGDPGRRVGLFANPAHPDPEENLGWWFHNRGKLSITLDLNDPAGRTELLRLVATADVLVESYSPGWMEDRGLGYAQLLEVNPRLVVTSITPYGQTGPCASWSASDLTVTAGTGELWLTGDADRAPVRVSVPQVFLHAAAEGAVHTMAALWHAQHTGFGQHVDVSAQLAGLRPLMNAAAFHLLEGRELMRVGPDNGRFRMINRCKDGHVAVLPAAGAIGGPMMRFFMDWADRDGVADPLVKDRDYSEINFVNEPPEFFAGVIATLAALFAKHTKAELYDAALEHLLLLAPVCTVADLRVDEQLAAREYFVPIDHGVEGGSDRIVATAGPWAKLSATPLNTQRRAPAVGEHTGRIADRTPNSEASAPEKTAPFAGLKVLDLSWVGVGPMTAGYLASYGATVIKVESSKRPDVLRLTNPFRNGEPGLNNSHFYGDFNPDKLGLGLDLSDARGRELAWLGLEWADVVVESFTPKALAGWGMDYAEIVKRNPSVVMLSTCMQGQTGPRRYYRGFGNLMAGLAGFYHLAGWPDRDPVMIYGAHTDFLSQRFAATALIAALDHRRRTGQGQHIDLSQYEAALQFLGPELLAYEIDGRVADRLGNRDFDRAPHGVFPCVVEVDRAARCPAGTPGAEAWVAISAENDAQWQELRATVGLPDEEAWRTLSGRKADEESIERSLAAWTATRTASEIVAVLQPRVAAAPVLGVPELHSDPQIAHRNYWVPLTHPVYGDVPYSGTAAQLSATPGSVRSPAPCLGQHSWEVLEQILGVDPDTIALLLAEGVVEITG